MCSTRVQHRGNTTTTGIGVLGRRFKVVSKGSGDTGYRIATQASGPESG